MKKFLGLILGLLITSNAFAAWGVTEPLGTRSVSDLDSYVGANNAALDLLLAGYQKGADLVYASSATLTVNAGEVVCSNSTGTVRLMARNTTSTTVAWTDIDTGSEAVSTTYYVYAIMSSTSDTTFTVKISTSSSAPSGITYYKRLGSFYNDASGNITLINNDNSLAEIGDWTSKTANVDYQALTDGVVTGYSTSGSGTEASIIIYSDSSSSPSATRWYQYSAYAATTVRSGGVCFVKKGDYYKVSGTGAGGIVVYWQPLQ